MIPLLPLDVYLVKKAYREFEEDGCFSITTYATLMEFGIHPESLEEIFITEGDASFSENFPLTFVATQEDVEDILDAAIANNIERLIDIRNACNNLIEED